MNMDRERSLDLIPLSLKVDEQYDDSALEGVAANVKLLLKLVQDHKEACQTHRNNDGRRMLRVAGMMTILDMVRTRIQKCQSFGSDRTAMKRCNSDMRTSLAENEKRASESTSVDEKEKLKRQLSASSAARKSLEVMCSSLGKEKEIMMGELARKAHELSEMEDHIEDLKAQNDSLLERVKDCAEVHEPGPGPGPKEPQGSGSGSMEVYEHNKALKDQLMRSLNGYRSMKRNLSDVREENIVMQSKIEEMGIKVSVTLEKIRKFRQNHDENSEEIADIEEGILELEHISKCLDIGDRKKGGKRGECGHVNKKNIVPKPNRASEKRGVL